MKWSAEYFHKVQGFWYENAVLVINSNGDPIIDFKKYAVIIGMPHPKLYTYFRDYKSKNKFIGNRVGNNITLLNGADIYFMGGVLVW